MAYSGKFMPSNPQKYKGNISKIEYRSLWELSFMRWCNDSNQVKRWNSEEVIVPYISQADQGKKRRYYVDFWVLFDDGQEFIFEVKPFKETMPPVRPKTNSPAAQKRLMKEAYTYQVNQDKWKAAVKVANSKGWKFRILTEKSLAKFGIKC